MKQKKLRNKKTGEIIDVYKGAVTLHYDQGRKTIHFKSLEDLEEWEDYEEDRRFWYIDVDGEIMSKEMKWFNQAQVNIGNCFETKEEAEKALEKLKAWKRLKDKGFRFVYHQTIGEYGSVSFRLDFPATKGVERDICLFFGGEE